MWPILNLLSLYDCHGQVIKERYIYTSQLCASLRKITNYLNVSMIQRVRSIYTFGLNRVARASSIARRQGHRRELPQTLAFYMY